MQLSEEKIPCKYCDKMIYKFRRYKVNKYIYQYEEISEYCDRACSNRDRGYTKINDDFLTFSKPEYAYIIGLLWADGSFHRKRLSINLIEEDMIKLEHIFDLCGIWSKRGYQIKHWKPIKTLAIGSVILCEKLENLDFCQKSLVSPIKILNIIPSKYHYIFLRGFIDGDGCWYYNDETRKKAFTLCGTINQDWSWITSILDNINVKSYKVRRIKGPKSSYSQLTFRKIEDLRKFGKYIYQDNLHLLLPRKYEKYQKIVLNFINFNP